MIVRDPKQIAALASPVRLAAVDALEGIGPSTVATLAKVIGTRPDGLYYHLGILEKRGLLIWHGQQVRLAARPLELRYDASDRQNRQAVTRVVASMVRAALRLFRRAFRAGARVRGPQRELWAAQRTAALSRPQLERVNRLLNELLEEFAAKEAPAADATIYSLTFLLAPQSRYGERL